jgi:hypothetical protein
MIALLIFLVIVILVTAALVYLYFNKLGPWKKEKSPAPAPAQTQKQVLPKITDFSVDRTLSPDGSSESYTIEPYTIEPYTLKDIIALSKNVNFTLKWTNGVGFKEAGVNEIKVYHGVKKNDDTTFDNSNDSNDWKLRYTLDETLDETSENANALKNFGNVTISISGLDGDDAYSFEGNNFFKVVALYGDDSSIELYNSYILWNKENEPAEKEKFAIKISSDDLVGTIDMTSSETVTYKPRLNKGQTLGKEISNKRYDFHYFENVSDTQGQKLFEKVRLVPVDDDGKQFKLEQDDKYFYVNSGTKEYLFDADANNASSVYIAESEENDNDNRDYEKVIMLRALTDHYLFGPDMGFKKLTDPSISNEDQFFRRNIYIRESSSDV